MGPSPPLNMPGYWRSVGVARKSQTVAGGPNTYVDIPDRGTARIIAEMMAPRDVSSITCIHTDSALSWDDGISQATGVVLGVKLTGNIQIQ